MSKQLGKLKQLPVNKTVVFWSPIEGDDVLVRTGTIAEGSCFVENTRVYTTEGVKNIQDVEIGDKVVTHLGNVRYVVQTHCIPLGKRNIHKLNIYNTPQIKVTNNHPFYAVKHIGFGEYSEPEWVEVSQLNNNYYVMIPNKKDTEEKDIVLDLDYYNNKSYNEIPKKYSFINTCRTKWTIDSDFCYFLGLWYGFGSVLTEQRNGNKYMKGISFLTSITDHNISDFIKKYGQYLLGVKSCVYINDKQKLIQIDFYNTTVAEIFYELFYDRCLPSFIYNIKNDLVKHFVSGLITADGFIDTKLNISLSMSNPLLIEEIYHLCRSCGIECSISYRPNHSGKIYGWMRFAHNSVEVSRIFKNYNDDRMERLLNNTCKNNGSNLINSVYIKGNTFLRVNFNEVISDRPEHVYTLGIDGDHSYAVEGVVVKNCFFHSLLHAYSKEYTAMDRNGRMDFVRRLRASMAGKVDHESWEEIGGGLIAKIPFQENVNDILVNFYRFISNDSGARGRNTRRVIKNLVGEDERKLEVYRLITELIQIDTDFEKNILPTAYSKTDNNKIAICRDAIIDETISHLNNKEEMKSVDKNKAEYIRSIVRKFLSAVLKEAEDSAFKDYVKGLQNVSVDVDTYTIGLISDRFKRDIYFLDGKTRVPYNNSSTTENLKGRKSMIVLWIGGNHYEIVGRLLPGNRIQREFSQDDPIIKKLYTFLVKPEEISEKFPELVSYLPQEYRNISTPSSNHHTYNDSEEDNKDSEELSDHYYDSSSEDISDESQ